MIQKIICDYLTDKLEVISLPEEPEETIPQYVIVEKTGGGSKNYINSSVVAIKSYDTSKYGACMLNERVKEVMTNIICLPKIISARLNSDYEYNDSTKKKYRYQAVYEIKHY